MNNNEDKPSGYGLASGPITRRQLVKTGAAGAVLLSAGPLLQACGSGEDSTTTGGDPQRGGTLNVGMIGFGASESIVPAKAIIYPDYARVAALYEPLFMLAPDQKSVPWLAEAATPNADASRWTLELRKDVIFHNGKPLTADDVVKTIRAWADPGNYMAPFVSQLIDFDGLKKVDKYTVEVPLSLAMVDFPSVLTYPNGCIVPDGIADPEHPVGTGAFKFESFDPGSRSEFVANQDYWVSGKPYLERLIIDTSFAEESARVNALLSGAVDYLPLMDPTLAKANEGNGAISIKSADGAGFFPFYMDTSSGVTADPKVRLALKLCADRPALVKGALLDYGTVQNDIVGYGLPFFYDDLEQPHDPERAKSLLQDAGVPGLEITLKTSQGNIGMQEAATLFAEQAKEADVKINLQKVPVAEYFVPTSGYPYQFAQSGWNPIPSVPLFYLLSFNGRHAAYNETKWGYSNPQDLKLLREALGTVDKAEADERWRALQEQQFNEGGYLVWSTWPYIDGVASGVAGIEPAPAGPAGNYSWRDAWLAA